MRTVIFAHGLEGRPDGKKPTALKEAGLDVIAPDGRGKVLAERIAELELELAGRTDVVLVGSSYGGAAAAILAMRHPERLAELVLLAPAIVFRDPPLDRPENVVIPASVPGTVIHATADDVIPVQASRDLVARSPQLALIEVDDEHALRGSIPLIVRTVLEAARR